jgi:hypothetical protein
MLILMNQRGNLDLQNRSKFNMRKNGATPINASQRAPACQSHHLV